MNYVVFDLEWNQCPYGKERENEKIPFEIIEIGAVKLNEQKQIIDQFHTLIQPRVYRRLHFRTREIIGLDMKELDKGSAFYKAGRDFIKWCGEDYRFCTWGNSDLIELQRNMKYYGVLSLLKGPILYCDVQKLFSLDFEDGDSRKSLEYAVDFLGMEKDQGFHRALADAVYTARVMERVDDGLIRDFYSIDCFQNPKSKEEEIKVFFPGYEKYISREFVSREAVMEDKEILSSRCCLCGKNARKKIRWFSSGQKNYYCLSYCPNHGWLKGKVRIKRTDHGSVFAVKTMKLTDDGEAALIREKKGEIQRKRRAKRRMERKAQT